MLSASFNSEESSPSHSHFVPYEPPLKKRRLTEPIEYIADAASNSDSPQFVLKNVNGEFKLVVVNEQKTTSVTTECINLITDNENEANAKTKTKSKPKAECISLLTSDSCNNNMDNTDNSTTNKKYVANAIETIKFHDFLNKPIMNDAADTVYQFFKDIIGKYKNEKNILSQIEIEGRIGMLLKKKPSKNNKHRNNRYLRISDDLFAKNNKNKMIEIYHTKQKGCKFDADVKKQTFYYFKTVMNGLYINAEILKDNGMNRKDIYPSMTFKFVNKIIYKYNNGVRDIEYITNGDRNKNAKRQSQKKRIGNLDICFNFEESDYDIRINAAIESDIDDKDNKDNKLDYRQLKCIRCKECIEYQWDNILKIEISTVHMYTNNLFDGRFIQTLRDNLLKRRKLPMTSDLKQRDYGIEIEIIDFKKFALKTNRQLKKLSLCFSNTCLQIAKLLGYVNDFAKKNNKLPVLSQFDVNAISKEIAQNKILPLFENPYYRNHHYHNVIHKQHINSNDNHNKNKDDLL